MLQRFCVSCCSDVAAILRFRQYSSRKMWSAKNMSRETSSKVKRDLFKVKRDPYQHRKSASLVLCPMRAVVYNKYVQRDQNTSQKRPTHKSKETHIQVKRDPHCHRESAFPATFLRTAAVRKIYVERDRQKTKETHIDLANMLFGQQKSCGPQATCQKKPKRDLCVWKENCDVYMYVSYICMYMRRTYFLYM